MLAAVHDPAALELEDDAAVDVQPLSVSLRHVVVNPDHAALGHQRVRVETAEGAAVEDQRLAARPLEVDHLAHDQVVVAGHVRAVHLAAQDGKGVTHDHEPMWILHRVAVRERRPRLRERQCPRRHGRQVEGGSN